VIGPKFIKTGSIHELPWPDNFFDVYFTAETIEHVPYKYHRPMLHEARRVLKPGGTAYLQGIIGFTDYLHPDPDDDAGHIAVFPRGYWLDMLEDAGFAHEANTPELYALHAQLADARYWRHYKWNFILAQSLR
jgi:ubiquinone/menaquinone biosynthesis C-methylase UbiE